MRQISPPSSAEQKGAVSFGPFVFDRSSGLLYRDHQELFLPPRALNVLHALVARAGEVVSKNELVSEVWHDAAVTDQSPAEAIGVLREILGDDSQHPTYIQTVHRRGYRFIANVEVTAPRATGLPEVSPSSLPQPSASDEAFPRARRTSIPSGRWLATAILTIGVVAVALVLRDLGDAPLPSPLQVALALPAPLEPSTPPSLALSPNGRTLVYRAAYDGGGDALHLLHLDRFAHRKLIGTEGGFGPFFSPDGQWVAYFDERILMKVSIRGGPPVRLARMPEGSVGGGSWADDGTIVFAAGARSKLWRVSAEGGQPALLAAPDPRLGEFAYEWPEMLPGSRWLLFCIEPVGRSAADESVVATLSMSTREIRKLAVVGGIQPRLLASDRLVFVHRGSLFTVPFDPDRPATEGSAEPIVEDLMTFHRGTGQFAVSAAGALSYIPGEAPTSHLVWIDRGGRREELELGPASYGRHRLSPDGRSVALEIDGDVWIHDSERKSLTRFTSNPARDLVPLWSPDGGTIVFSSNRDGPLELLAKPVDGSAPERPLWRSSYSKLGDSWSRDGKWLAFTEIHPDTGGDLWLLAMPSADQAEPLVRTDFHESQAAFSPDGRWIAFVSNEPGDFEVFVQAFPGPGPRYQVSMQGGSSPEWSPSGRELFYFDNDQLLSVEIESASPFRAGSPQVVADVPDSTSFFAVGPDGASFLAGQRLDPVHPSVVHLVSDAPALISDLH